MCVIGEAALRKDAGMPEVSFAIGFIHFKRRELGQASEWLEKELALQPCHAKSHYYMGEVEAASGRSETAEARYRRAIRCDNRQAASHAGLGGLLSKERRYEEAVGVLQTAVSLDPNSADAHYSLGRALLHLGRKQEAEAAFRRVDEIHTAKHETARRALGNSAPGP